MEEKIEGCFKDFISALQIARLYPDWHPQFQKAVDKAYLSLEDILKEREELVIGIVAEELAFEKEIFFSLSNTAKPIIMHLKNRGIERIAFHRGLNSEELSKFISFLIKPKEGGGHGPEEALPVLGVKNIIAGKIKASQEPQSIEEKVKKSLDYLMAYEGFLDKVAEYTDAVLEGGKLDSPGLRLTISDVMENLLGRYQDFLNLALIKRYDTRTFSHILNVSMLSMYFASRVGFAKQEVLEVGIAGLFHDIGKMYISRKILQKPQRLTDEEFAAVRSHVVIGAEILLNHVDTLGRLPAVVSFEHHLRYNLTGYPKISFAQPLHIASLIVSICDVYDALSQRRIYKGDYPPEMIYELMRKEKGTTFEPALLDRFFQIMGVWPEGTIVSLSDGSIAVVREENEDDQFHPKVEVIAPPDKKQTIDLKSVKDTLKIERSLNILKEGRDYLSLV